MASEDDAVVTASDICDYVYDPQKWWKQEASGRYLTQQEQAALENGTVFHREVKAFVQSTGELPWKPRQRKQTVVLIFAIIAAFFLWQLWQLWRNSH